MHPSSLRRRKLDDDILLHSLGERRAARRKGLHPSGLLARAPPGSRLLEAESDRHAAKGIDRIVVTVIRRGQGIERGQRHGRTRQLGREADPKQWFTLVDPPSGGERKEEGGAAGGRGRRRPRAAAARRRRAGARENCGRGRWRHTKKQKSREGLPFRSDVVERLLLRGVPRNRKLVQQVLILLRVVQQVGDFLHLLALEVVLLVPEVLQAGEGQRVGLLAGPARLLH
mmetsp:Transcript_4949/g.14017  ORF Transcript_4949/g.14017 Transcript_4949/m.14017 type:complete len:228 (-) Transcript_4949:1028-1711(-)